MSARDDRTKQEKLEAMANQTASPREAEVAKAKLHVLFARRGGAPKKEDHGEGRGLKCPYCGMDFPGDPHKRDLPNARTARMGHMKQKHPGPAPHEYQPGPGGDPYGCVKCARSRENPIHSKQLT